MTTSYRRSDSVHQPDPELETPLFIELMANLRGDPAPTGAAVDTIDLRHDGTVGVDTAPAVVTGPLGVIDPVDYDEVVQRAEELAPILVDYRAVAEAGRPEYRRLRRLWDLAFVLALGVVAVPLVALAALALKLEDRSAPVFYRQYRTGHLGRRFQIVKLRSMVANADDLKAQLADQNLRNGPDFKVVDDPRITRVGRFLRRTSIDELPQLWNVLRGEMTLVGPRPTSLGIDAYKSWQLERFDVLPGLTGLWQATARDSESWEDRLALDITYVRRACPALDWWIVGKTVRVVLSGTGST